MTHIDWEKGLNIGLPILDEQHKKLISFSNSLLHAMTVGKGEETLKTVFNELKSYTVYHFADEEKYMKELGYPHLEEHRLLHSILIKRVDDFRDRLLYATVTPNEVVTFLNSWIVTHIMEEDSRIGEYAANRRLPAL